MPDKKTVVAVIGSGTESHVSLTEPLGKWLAGQGCDLINGGGGGVMAAVSQAFAQVADRQGRVIGVIPSSGPCDSPEARAAYAPPTGYPNDWIDFPIYTHLHQSGTSGKKSSSRNHIIILTADVIVAFPGGEGTRSEIQLALEYGKPLVILNPDQGWEEFKGTAALMADNPEKAIQMITKFLNKAG